MLPPSNPDRSWIAAGACRDGKNETDEHDDAGSGHLRQPENVPHGAFPLPSTSSSPEEKAAPPCTDNVVSLREDEDEPQTVVIRGSKRRHRDVSPRGASSLRSSLPEDAEDVMIEDEDEHDDEREDDDEENSAIQRNMRWITSMAVGGKRKEERILEETRKRLASVSLRVPSWCPCRCLRSRSLPLYFRDPQMEAEFVSLLYPNDLRLMFLLVFFAFLSSAAMGVFHLVLPLIISAAGWREDWAYYGSYKGQSWLFVCRGICLLAIAVGHWLFFLGPRCIAVCIAKKRIRAIQRRSTGGKKQLGRRQLKRKERRSIRLSNFRQSAASSSSSSDDESRWGVDSVLSKESKDQKKKKKKKKKKNKTTNANYRSDRLLSPTVVRILELGLFLSAAQHMILVDFGAFLGAVSDNRYVFGWSSLAMLGNSTDFFPILLSIGAYSVVVLTVPLRMGYLLLFTFTTIVWSLATNGSALFVLIDSTSPAHAVGNAMFCIIIPIVLCVAAMYNTFAIRKLLQLKEKTRIHGVATSEESAKLFALLSHVIPSEYIPAVQQNRVVLLETAGVAALEVDIESFTAWTYRKSSEAVIRYIHLLFTRFDRCRVGLKLRQAGDAWIALSLPYVGPKGILEMLKMAILALRCSERVNKETGERLSLRLGVGYSREKGALVAWGTQTKSLDFVGEALQEAITLEMESIPGSVHVRRETLSLLESHYGALPSQLDVHPTSVGVCLTPESTKQVVTSCTQFPVAVGRRRVHRRCASLQSIALGPSLSPSVVASSLVHDPMVGSSARVTLKAVWAIVKNDLWRCTALSVTRGRCLTTFMCCFFCTVAQLIDLLVVSMTDGPEHTILSSVFPVVILGVFFLFFMLFLRVPAKSLRVVLTAFSVVVLSLRCFAEMLVTSLCPVGLGSLVRILCWDWTFPLLHIHLNLFVVAGVLVVPLIGQAMLFLHSHSVKVTSAEHLVESS